MNPGQRGAERHQGWGIVLVVVGVFVGQFLARLDLGGVARDCDQDAPSERALDQSGVDIILREKIAFRGTCDRRSSPRM